MSVSITNSEPGRGTGLLLPLLSGSPSSILMHSTAITLPCFAMMRVRVAEVVEVDALFLRVVDLDGVRRHLRLCPPVDEVDVGLPDPKEERTQSMATFPPPTTTTFFPSG